MRVCRWRRISLETHCCTLFLKVSWAKKGILSGRLNLGTVALQKMSTRRSRARALDRQGCSMWLAKLPGGVVFLLGVAGDGVGNLPKLGLLG